MTTKAVLVILVVALSIALVAVGVAFVQLRSVPTYDVPYTTTVAEVQCARSADGGPFGACATFGPAVRVTEPSLNVRVANQQPLPPDRPYVPYRATPNWVQVGFVYDAGRTVRAPMYGRPAPRNPSRWQYFVRTSDADVRIAVRKDGRSSLEDVGCYELQTGDVVQVPELLEGGLTAHVYDTLQF